MNKSQFIESLQTKLKGYPKNDIKNSQDYFCEIIDEKIANEHLLEDEAIASLGDIDDIVKEIIASIPLNNLIKNKFPTKKLSVWEWTLIIVGSPLWISILLALMAVGIAIYAVICSLVLTIFAVNIALFASSVATIIPVFLSSTIEQKILFIGYAILSFGLGWLMLYLSKICVKLLIKFTKNIFIIFKKSIRKKEN